MIKYMTKSKAFLFVAGLAAYQCALAQRVTIDSCYAWSNQNYPLIKKAELISKTGCYNLSNIANGALPQINFTGQGSYQSDVTAVAIPGANIQPLSKDQYKLYTDVSETIYAGGLIKTQKQIQQTLNEIDEAGLAKDLYDIKDRVNQLYFGALAIQEQVLQNQLLIKQLSETKTRIESAYKNGTAYKSDVDQIKATILLQTQQGWTLQSGLNSYLQMLSAFTGKKIDSAGMLSIPVIPNMTSDTVNNRPELKLFSLQNKLYSDQIKLINAKNAPKLSLFGQGGYGKPGLNFLKDAFVWYYIGGVRVNWNISSLYSAKKDKAILDLSKRQTDVQKEIFLLNNNLSLTQLKNENDKIEKFLQNDDEIISLKESVELAAKSKYENGVITLNDYLKEITELNKARQDKALHRIQLIANLYNQNTDLGK